MNFILIGGAILGAMVLGPDGPDSPKAPVETTISAPAQQPAEKPAPRAGAVQKTAQTPVGEPEDRGWMTRELSVDRKTGETTEVSVIGFAD